MGDSWDKIRLKAGPKQYKLGPGPTGKDRLARRVSGLLLAASRLQRKTADADEEAWCADLVARLRAFVAAHSWKPPEA